MALGIRFVSLCGYITRSIASLGVGSGRLPMVRRRPVTNVDMARMNRSLKEHN
jgi:hypothetical protein